MSRLVFDFSGAMAKAAGEKGFSEKELSGAAGGMSASHKQLESKSLGFKRLPARQEDILDDIINTGKEIRENYDNFVVLGIGGSALGPIAVHTALSHGENTGINFFVEDNIDPERMARLLSLDMEKTMFNVISKSGKTSETMAQLMAVAAALEKKGLPIARHIIATTDAKNGNLVRIAEKEGLKTFVIPDDVGGRFSELTPVGLLSAAVCGFDVRAMLQGAAQMNDALRSGAKPGGGLCAAARARHVARHERKRYDAVCRRIKIYFGLVCSALGRIAGQEGNAGRTGSVRRADARKGAWCNGPAFSDTAIYRRAVRQDSDIP